MAPVSNGVHTGTENRPLTTKAVRGRDAAHWRTVDPAIPRQVAPLQSLRLFHRARLRVSCEAPAEFGAGGLTVFEESLQRVAEALVVDA